MIPWSYAALAEMAIEAGKTKEAKEAFSKAKKYCYPYDAIFCGTNKISYLDSVDMTMKHGYTGGLNEAQIKSMNCLETSLDSIFYINKSKTLCVLFIYPFLFPSLGQRLHFLILHLRASSCLYGQPYRFSFVAAWPTDHASPPWRA